MPIAITSNVHVERDLNGFVRQLRHLQQPYRSGTLSGISLAEQYLQEVAEIYQLPINALTTLQNRFEQSDRFTGEPTHLYFFTDTTLLGTTTITFVQTLGGLPIWQAGLSVTVQTEPDRVTSSFSTFHHDAKVEAPERELRAYSLGDLVHALRLQRPIQITSQRRLIYRYESAMRIDPAAIGPPTPLQGPNPTLPLPPVHDAIRDGNHYVVAEVLFTTDSGVAALNWRVFINERTGSVLYLRALLACVCGNIFHIDPVSDTGNNALMACSGDATLDPIQVTVTLPVISANPQSLTSEFVTLSDFRLPPAAPPTSPPVNFTALPSSSVDFGAVNAFHHVDRFFRLMSDLGFDPTTYFNATRLPLPVDHLDTTHGDPQAWTYGNIGNVGCSGIGFAHASTSCQSPVLIACDQRVAFHECSHLILLERIHDPHFGFSHSTGDSLAIIFADSRSAPPDRFVSFPFVPIGRRHDRDVAAGWAWGGMHDDKNYGSEQILATTQFRLYRSTGGDDDLKAVQTYGANNILYLIIRAVGSLGPAPVTPTPSADVWATALMNADIGTSSFEGIPGGTMHKVIRWAFEKQGLYQPPGATPPPNVITAGAPPAVDVYIDDGRGGEYPYLKSFWNNTDIWNSHSADGGPTHEPPIPGVANYAYVRVKNRGMQSASNVEVSGYHARAASLLFWPDDWTPMTTASLAVGSIPSGGSVIVGPFVWTPRFLCDECMLMVASADGDLPNTDPLTCLPCAKGPTPEWRLVPFDNNIGQRNIVPVIGGGGREAFVASLHNRSFTARNPFDRSAHITLETKVPAFLMQRGWSVRFVSAGEHSFSLPPRGRCEVVFTIIGGEDFNASDVPTGPAALIEIHTRVDGLLIGGMSYQVDPNLKGPSHEEPPRQKTA